MQAAFQSQGERNEQAKAMSQEDQQATNLAGLMLRSLPIIFPLPPSVLHEN